MQLVLGQDWQRALWASPYRLRFALNEDGDYLNRYVTRFTASYDRARRIARHVFPADTVVGIIAEYPEPKREMTAEWHGWMAGTGFDHLEKLGVSTKRAIATWRGYWWQSDENDDEAELHNHRAVHLNWHQADILIWNQVAKDLGVAPQAPVHSKLVDLVRGLSFHVYDDRGMDVTSLAKEPVIGLYEQLDDWLLDFERPRMSQVFKGG